MSKIAAGLEVGALVALELALVFIKLCPTVRAGTFDLFQVYRTTGAGRHAVCRPVFPCQNIQPGGREWWLHPRDVPQML